MEDEEERSFLAASDLLQSRAELLATFDPDLQEVALNSYLSPKIYIRKTQLFTNDVIAVENTWKASVVGEVLGKLFQVTKTKCYISLILNNFG